MLRLPISCTVVVMGICVMIANAASQTADCQASADSIVGSTATLPPGVYAGSTSRAVVPGVSTEQGVDPQTRTGISLGFSETASDRRAVEQAGVAAAREYIDASQPLHAPRQ